MEAMPSPDGKMMKLLTTDNLSPSLRHQWTQARGLQTLCDKRDSNSISKNHSPNLTFL